MIQFNLLPSVKLEYVRAKRVKRLTLLGSAVVASAALLLLILLFANVQLQAKHSRDLSADISKEGDKLEDVEDISSILTIQNQLNSLETLHSGKPEVARAMGYLETVTPTNVKISGADFDFAAMTVTLNGSAESVAAVNAYLDTLKFTTYESEDKSVSGNAFSDVVLGSVSPSPDTNTVEYNLTFKFDPVIFSNASNIKLMVPQNQVTSRSEIDKPDSVFSPEEGE